MAMIRFFSESLGNIDVVIKSFMFVLKKLQIQVLESNACRIILIVLMQILSNNLLAQLAMSQAANKR